MQVTRRVIPRLQIHRIDLQFDRHILERVLSYYNKYIHNKLVYL